MWTGFNSLVYLRKLLWTCQISEASIILRYQGILQTRLKSSIKVSYHTRNWGFYCICFPLFLFCQFSIASGEDVFYLHPSTLLSSLHHFIASRPPRPETLICEIVGSLCASGYLNACASHLHVCVYGGDTWPHGHLRREEDEGGGKTGGILLLVLLLSLSFLKQLIIWLCLAAWLRARI